MFPAKHGSSSTHSSSALLGEPKPQHNEHLQHSLEEHIQVGLSSQVMNATLEQTMDGTCLSPFGGASGGHDFMNQNTGKVVN